MEPNQLPNLWQSPFNQIDTDRWIEDARRTVSLNVLQAENLFMLAIDFFEASMIVHRNRNKEYAEKVKKKRDELWTDNRLTEPERARKFALFKLEELTLIADEIKIRDKEDLEIIPEEDREWIKSGGRTESTD